MFRRERMVWLLAALASLDMACWAAGPFPEKGICGHGGDLADCPEDSVVGLKSAIAKGAHMVEFDVQRCKTGELVSLHDGNLSRNTTVTGSLSRSTFEHVRSARLKHKPKDPNEKVPTLDEMLDALPRTGVIANIHCYGDDLVARDAALRMGAVGTASIGASSGTHRVSCALCLSSKVPVTLEAGAG